VSKGGEVPIASWCGHLKERENLEDRRKQKDNIKMNLKEAG